MRSATSSSSFTSNAKAIRRTLPKVLISKGTREPLGFSNSSAGPTLCGARSLSLATRCATSVISSTGSTSVRVRFSSPSFSSSFTNSRKSAYATVLSCLAELYHERLSVLVNVERERRGACCRHRRKRHHSPILSQSHDESQKLQADTNCLRLTINVRGMPPLQFERYSVPVQIAASQRLTGIIKTTPPFRGAARLASQLHPLWRGEPVARIHPCGISQKPGNDSLIPGHQNFTFKKESHRRKFAS